MNAVTLTRRTFIKSSLAIGVLGSAVARRGSAEPHAGVPYRLLGRKGEKVSLVGLGGFHVGMQATEPTVRMPLNVMDAHFDSFEKKVVPELLAAGVGVLGMKSLGDHEILKSGTATAVECLHDAMNLPTSVVITGGDSLPILEQALGAARSFKPLTDEERGSLLAKTAPEVGKGRYELDKTSQRFDGTAQNSHWLG